MEFHHVPIFTRQSVLPPRTKFRFFSTASGIVHADFAITQFFFRLDDYLGLVNDLADLGIEKPIIPGIMPVTNLSQVARMAQLSGASVPAEITGPIERASAQGPGEARRVGLELATTLCRQLLDAGAPGLHFITLNRSTATREMWTMLGLGTPHGDPVDKPTDEP